jgi:hypothetical protein
LAISHVIRIFRFDPGASVAKLGKLLVRQLEEGAQPEEASAELNRRFNL